jgi:CRISPR/Cas system CSM-associated protein Csm3 (group 7 of RAMP superfamily)
MLLSEVIAEMSTYEWKLAARLLSDLHIATGSGGAAWIDKAVIRDSKRHPVIPGSHLKGVVRDNAESLADFDNTSSCRAPRAENMCRSEQDACIVCKVFGGPTIPSALRFSDLTWAGLAGGSTRDDIAEWLKSEHGPSAMEKLDPDLCIQVRNGVSIDRYRRVAKDARLFNLETVSRGALFSGSLYIIRRLSPVELALVRRAIRLTNKLGGKKSTGLGEVELILQEEAL